MAAEGVRASQGTASLESIADLLAGVGPLYAVLDAAREPAIVEHLARSGEVFESLYDGRRARQVASSAPYLAQVSPSRDLGRMLLRDGWGKSWGSLLAAHAPFADVRRHLRTYLTVELPSGEAVAFRFWDPRVLRVFLASSTEDEARAFFGPAHAWFVEGPQLGELLRFERVGPAPPVRVPPWDLPRIGDEVCARLAEDLAAAFVDRQAARLADALRPWATEGTAARTLVEQAVARAEAHGIAEEDVPRYLDLVAALGPHFDEQLPWAAAILARPELDARQKLARLERYVRQARRPRGTAAR
jgi:hypothetical protein